MNAINVIIAFVILLGLLLYYLQRRNSMLETSRKEIENKRKPQIIKARDYQAKYEKEKALETKTETSETIPEQELGKGTGTDNLSELEGVGSKYQNYSE